MSNNPYKQAEHSTEDGPPTYESAINLPTPTPQSTAYENTLTVPQPQLNSNHSYNNTEGSTASSDNTHEDNNDNNSTSEGGIPRDVLREIRNENRELPAGWIREYDPKSEHLFYVDTKATPARVTWNHPYDDPEYLQTLPDTHPALQSPSRTHNLTSSQPAASTSSGNSHINNGSGRPEKSEKGDGKISFGRKMKDKLTGSTHDERVEKRRKQKELEQKQYAAYLKRQQALAQAQANGTYRPMYGAPAMGYSRGPYRNSGYGYGNSGYGYGGYGGGMGMGGMGMGMGLGLGGGLLGGMMLGSMMDGGMGGGYGGGGFGDGGGGGGGDGGGGGF